MRLVNRAAVRKRCLGNSDANLLDVIGAETVLVDEFGQRMDDALNGGDAGIKLEPDPHDLEFSTEIAGDFVGLHHIRKDFQKSRSEEHTSELQSRVDISYAVFCL